MIFYRTHLPTTEAVYIEFFKKCIMNHDSDIMKSENAIHVKKTYRDYSIDEKYTQEMDRE